MSLHKSEERYTVHDVTKFVPGKYSGLFLLLIATLLLSTQALGREFSEQALSKAPPGLLKRIFDKSPVELIILLDDSDITQQTADLRDTKSLTFDDVQIRELKANAYVSQKQDLVGDMIQRDIEIITDYLHLPMLFVRIRNMAALSRLLRNTRVVRVYENEPHFLSLTV